MSIYILLLTKTILCMFTAHVMSWYRVWIFSIEYKFFKGNKKMKKIITIFFTLFIGLIIAGCATTTTAAPAPLTSEQQARVASGRSINGGYPQFVRDAALKNAPPDALVGVGSAKLPTLSQSRTIAQTRARAEISRAMGTMMQEMINDSQAGSELDHSAALGFSENTLQALSKATLVGAVIVEEDMDVNGMYWVVIYLNKANVVNEINQAQAAAKLAVPAAHAFDANKRMNEAFDRALARDIQGVTQ